MHWITGEIDPAMLEETRANDAKQIEIIDAVHAFGNLTPDETARLLDRARHGAIVLGSAQKWLSSPLPLGFAIMPVDLLASDAGFASYIAARDYLGNSIQPRNGFSGFPDTYCAPLAGIFIPFLDRAMGRFDPAFLATQRHVANNRAWMAAVIEESTGLDVLGARDRSRGMVAASGAKEVISAISHGLHQQGFPHSVFHGLPAENLATLRLSAPTVPLQIDDKNRLQEILETSHAHHRSI
uniref:Uncharacterized protein n=1 Tax=Candidatus Kentrum sp. FM TaxID=2126340 RepID=A0A450SFA3_9GAMM|nr:MAG: hypothetical protein BECKFM1743C_GA0114222_100979 [Candidatus Kentron sp. FM]VFJ54293.1 MAG: hypothetical protein BECKFM1743A_GA0114220_101294 [Candidatus Kentron sp. FM]VFK08397.1 MAG: hypothetical protein BECKFM1743B_GA0114221_1006811 [Candidatus Kentron sp. FM]